MNFRRFTLLLFILLILLLPVAWFTAPLWVAKVGELILAEQQCSDVVIDIEAIGWNESHINRLYCKDQKETLTIDLKDVVANYTVEGLLAKRLEHVTLDSMAIELRPSIESKAEPMVMPALMMPSLLLEALPVARFEVSNIQLLRQNRDGEVLQVLKGHANYASDQGLSLDLHEVSGEQGLQAHVYMDKHNQVQASLYRGEALIFKIDSTMQKQNDRISIDGRSEVELAPAYALLESWLNMPEQQLQGMLHASWQLSLPAQSTQTGKALLQQLDIKAELEFDAALKREDLGQSSGRVGLNVTYKQGMGVWSLAEKSQLTFEDKQMDLSALSGTFGFASSGWNVTIAEKSKLWIKNIHINGMRIAYAQISFIKSLEIAKDANGEMSIVQEAALNVVLPKLRREGLSLASRGISLAMNPGSLFSPSGSFIASGIKFTSPDLQLAESNISGTFDLSGKQVSVTGSINAKKHGIQLNWMLKHQSARQKGSLRFTFEPLVFGEGAFDLSRIVDDHGDYALESGTLNLNGTLNWKKKRERTKLDAVVDLKLSNLNGFYKTNQFSGLSGDLHFTADENYLLMAPALVSLDRLHAGVPVNNISMRAAFSYPMGGKADLQINQLMAEALGGNISSERISIDFARANNPFVVKLAHIDAGKIAEIRQQEGLHIKGLLDGVLPFNLTSDGLHMNAGELKSGSAGGLIRYLGTESVRNLAATDHATKMVMDIMNNFYYNVLKVGADYSPGGELKLQIKLQGNNPEYEQGRAVEFNFNIEENVLKLMQGLSMASGISGAVEKKVQKSLQKQ